MTLLLDHFRATGDPFAVGHSTGEYLTLGYALTHGLVFPWTGGGRVLRRRRLYPDVGAWTFCGFARPADVTISNMSGFTHAANESFQYAAAVVLGNGFAGRFSEPVRVDFDATGARITPPLPMFPLGVAASPISGGRILVSWEYDPYGQGAWPTDFQVFAGSTPVSVNYNTPLVDSSTGLDTVRVIGSTRGYSFTTEAFAHATPRVFSVRARNSSGVPEKNTRTSTPRLARATTASAASLLAVGSRRI